MSKLSDRLDTHESYLRCFDDVYKKCKQNPEGDKQVFVNVYEMCESAIKEARCYNPQTLLVRKGIGDSISEELDHLQEIKDNLVKYDLI